MTVVNNLFNDLVEAHRVLNLQFPRLAKACLTAAAALPRNENAPEENEAKYEKGTFGHWWVVERGQRDIAEKVFTGDIHCNGAQLMSLIGSPRQVIGNFNCSRNLLTSLAGGPLFVQGDFICDNNPRLTSFEGAPEYIGKNFVCRCNPGIKSPVGLKHVTGVVIWSWYGTD